MQIMDVNIWKLFCQIKLLRLVLQVTKLQTSERRSTYRVERQVARMVVVMVLAFLVTWLPYAAMAMAIIMDSNLYIDPVIATIPVYLAKSSTVYNPIIYIFMNRQVSLHHYLCAHTTNQQTMYPEVFVFQFRGYAVPALLCGWSPWPPEAPISDATTTVVNKNKVVLEQSSKE